MAEYPISFKPSMIRTILARHKTETRRIIRPPFEAHPNGFLTRPRKNERLAPYPCPYGKPGDTLWVRERWSADPNAHHPAWSEHSCSYVEWYGTGQKAALVPEALRTPDNCIYCASWPGPLDPYWRPSIFMPRWASRIILTVTGSSWERLHDITEAGAIREGVTPLEGSAGPNYYSVEGEHGWWNAPTAMETYRLLWNEIANERTPAKGGIPCDFDANPLVWVVQFEVKEVRGAR